MTAIQPVPFEDPDQFQILPVEIQTPYGLGWWTQHTLEDIPFESVGWLVAQNWTITGVELDENSIPPVAYYSMTKKSLENFAILEALLESWEFAYNEARAFNSIRYNAVIEDWTEMVISSQTQFELQVAAHNDHTEVFLGDLGLYMDQVDKLIEDNKSDLIEDVAVATTALTAMDAKLTDLEDNVTEDHTDTIEDLLTAQANYLTTFLADLVAKREELDSNYTAHLEEIETILDDEDAGLQRFAGAQLAAAQALSAAHTEHVEELDTLLTSAGEYLETVETDINAVLTSIASDYTDVDTEVNALITEGDTALDNHATDYNAVLAKLKTDYDDHEGIAEQFLVDLGSTELARINEEFNASLATQMQQLADQGLYTSAVAADITARNTRDRDEQVQALSDRLNREKLENQHKLYGQQTAMRTATMAGQDRIHTVQQEVWQYQASQITGLYQLLQAMRERTLAGKQAIYAVKDANNRLNIEVRSTLFAAGQEVRRVLLEEVARLRQLEQAVSQFKAGERNRLLEYIQNVVTQHLAGLDRQHAAEQSVSQAAVSVRNTLLEQLQDAVKGLLEGRSRYATQTTQNASVLAEQRSKMIIEKMNEFQTRLQGSQAKHEEAMKLMAYQLDERNKLLIGIYGFVERRSDPGPSIDSLIAMCTGLGDSGGGWVTP